MKAQLEADFKPSSTLCSGLLSVKSSFVVEISRIELRNASSTLYHFSSLVFALIIPGKRLQLDNVSENQSSARTCESSPRLRQSLRKTRDPISANVSTITNLTKDEQSAILIQRAWRQHRTRGLELRKQQRAQDMQERAEAREKEAATRLIKSTIHGHLSRESSLRVNQNNDAESVTDELDTVTFATESSGAGSVISQENKSK
ncbi:hypothetical protein FGIG_12245, partial [Fasciola gigantica]